MSSPQHHRRAALITGAAGRLGQMLCDHLAGQGKSIIGLYREKLPKAHKNVLPLCCDLQNIESLIAPLKSTDTVVHLAWQGGRPGGTTQFNLNGDQLAQESLNVAITKNILSAMERAGAKRIIFLSWVGVDRHADQALLRQKYWAENAIINSTIAEKIIIRAGLINSNDHVGEFTRAAGMIAKFPLLLPLPKGHDGVVITTIPDILTTIADVVKTPSKNESYCKIIDLTSTNPSAGASILRTIDEKIWNKKRIYMSGMIGEWFYQCLENKMGFHRATEPRLRDYFNAATLPCRSPAEGLPGTPYGLTAGQKTELNKVF